MHNTPAHSSRKKHYVIMIVVRKNNKSLYDFLCYANSYSVYEMLRQNEKIKKARDHEKVKKKNLGRLKRKLKRKTYQLVLHKWIWR